MHILRVSPLPALFICITNQLWYRATVPQLAIKNDNKPWILRGEI